MRTVLFRNFLAVTVAVVLGGGGLSAQEVTTSARTKQAFFKPETYRSISPTTFAIITTGSSTSYADFEASADQEAFSMRAYGSAFSTFMHANVDLHNMAEFWADQFVTNANRGLLIGTGYGFTDSQTPGPPIIFATNNTVRMRVLGDGRVSIGEPTDNTAYMLNVNGIIHATKVIGATYQDLAEWVPANGELDPGTVVVLNHAHKNEVQQSADAYDTGVAGVVSEQPGIVLGEGGEGRAQVATTGRVKVKVDATRTPIEIGDLLVTSDIPGTAMKSEPMTINGRKFHQPGTIVGKALEPLSSGTERILVLLSLQ